MFITFPRIDRKRWKSIIFVAILTTFVRIMFQPMIPAGESQASPSVLVDAGLLIPAFIVYAFIAYIVMAYSFAMIEAGLPWSKMRKGLAFGSLLGLIWVAYLFEPVPLGQGTPFLDMLAYPIADGVSVLILGVLLGRFVATPKGEGLKMQHLPLLALFSIPLVMLILRSFEYNVLHIYSSYEDHTMETLIWVIVTGLCIALAYFLLRRGIPSYDPVGRAMAFGIFFYGIPITFVNFFVVLALKIDVGDMALRSVVDTIAVIIGISIAELLFHRWEGMISLK